MLGTLLLLPKSRQSIPSLIKYSPSGLALFVIVAPINFVSGLSLFLNLLNSLKERKYEMALIRTIGGTKVQTSLMLFYESIILCIIGFVGGIILSRIGILVTSNLLEESLNYSISMPIFLSSQELILLIFSISIGIFSCIIPAFNVYKMNISKTLTDE